MNLVYCAVGIRKVTVEHRCWNTSGFAMDTSAINSSNLSKVTHSQSLCSQLIYRSYYRLDQVNQNRISGKK